MGASLMAGTPDVALLERLRAVVAEQPATEAELRTLADEADALAGALGTEVVGTERRLDELTADPDSSLHDIAAELRRVETLRPQLEEVRSLRRGLDTRARELRSAWLRGAG